MNIYLAGGLKTNWRDPIIAAHPLVTFFNPMDLYGKVSIADSAEIEREWLRQSDVVFAYWEVSNPVPLGLVAEVTHAKDAKILFCVDRADDHWRRAEWLAAFWHTPILTFAQGIDELRQMIAEGEPA